MNAAGSREDPRCALSIAVLLDELPDPGAGRLNPFDVGGQFRQIRAVCGVKIEQDFGLLQKRTPHALLSRGTIRQSSMIGNVGWPAQQIRTVEKASIRHS